jgi:hypothetical protein
MTDTILVSLAVTAGLFGLAGVPLRCWQATTGRLRAQIPRHAIAQATFGLFSALFLAPNVLAWIYVLSSGYRDFTCASPCDHAGIASMLAVGLLGCSYTLLEGFLMTARSRGQAGNAAVNSATKRA